MASAGLQILKHVAAVTYGGVGQVAGIRIDAEPGTVDQINIFHGLRGGVHELGLHGLKSENHAFCRRHLCRLCQVLFKKPYAVRSTFFIINVISCKLNDPDSQIIGKLYGFFHDLHTAFPDGGIGGAEGILAVAGQAHAADRDAGSAHLPHQLKPLFFCPVKTGKLVICLVYADLHEIIAAFSGAFQLLGPCHGFRHRFFIKADCIRFHRAGTS